MTKAPIIPCVRIGGRVTYPIAALIERGILTDNPLEAER